MNLQSFFEKHKVQLCEMARTPGIENRLKEIARDFNVTDDDAIVLIREANRANGLNEESTGSCETHGGTGSEQRIVAHGLADFLGLEFPPREPVLDPWLPTQGLAMVYAPRGLGKTHFALNIAYAVATGGKYLGWEAKEPRSVSYFDGEMPAVTLQDRLSVIVENDERSDISADPNALRIVAQENQEPAMPDLSSIEGQRLFDQVTSAADLIIVDNISTLCRAGAENKADDWNIVSEWALRMRRYGKTVLFIHHAGKGGQQRGTSKREDILDVVIALRPTLDDSHDGAQFEVHFEKARHLFGDDINSFVARLDRDGKWKTEELEDSTYRKVVSLANEGMTVTEIAKEIDRAKSNVSRHMKKAKQNGDVVGENGGASSSDYASRRAGE